MKKLILTFSLLISISDLNAQRILWEETFINADIQSRGWKMVNNDSSSSSAGFYNEFDFVNLGHQAALSGSYFYMFSFANANQNDICDDWLISPKLYNIHTGDTLSFWCGAIDQDFADSLKIWISELDDNLSSFIMIDHFKVEGPAGAWHKKSYDLSHFAGKNIYFALNYHMVDAGPLGHSSDNTWIDDFILTGKGVGGVEPQSFELQQNFPNPFNPSTEISFSVLSASRVDIRVYNTLGKEVLKLIDGNYEKGKYSVMLNAVGFPSGVYFYKMTAANNDGEIFSDSKKLNIVK